MRVSRSTKQKVADITADLNQARQQMYMAKVRLEEHSGTKRKADKLGKLIEKFEDWLRAA